MKNSGIGALDWFSCVIAGLDGEDDLYALKLEFRGVFDACEAIELGLCGTSAQYDT